MSTPTQAQITAAEILDQIRRILADTPTAPDQLALLKVSVEPVRDTGLGIKTVDLSLGNGSSLTMTLWERKR